MEYAVVCTVALLVACLTLFSGFGLGTLLMPAFALFFPVEVAIAATAVVHLANNVFKLVLIGRWADLRVVIRFGVPAVFAAAAGALVLELFASVEPVATYTLLGRAREVTPIKLAIGAVIIVFSVLELSPRMGKLQFDRRWLPAGGVLSGFFGGLSGHQGALRAAFLIRSGLDKRGFVGTAAVCSTLVDVTRLVVYAAGASIFSRRFAGVFDQRAAPLVLAACAAAFLGSIIGKKLVGKITLGAVKVIVGVGLLTVGAALAAGVI